MLVPDPPTLEATEVECSHPMPHRWTVRAAEFIPPGKTEWRAFSHGTFDTLEQAQAFREQLGQSGAPLRICRYVGSSSETRTVVQP